MSDHGFEIHGFELGESTPPSPRPGPGSYALVPSHGYDQPDGMILWCDPLTEVEWRRPDGNLLRSAVVTSAGGIEVLLHQVREPYDLYLREPGGEWRRTYEFRPHPSGRILITHVEDQT